MVAIRRGSEKNEEVNRQVRANDGPFRRIENSPQRVK